ncbi:MULTISPECIES: hypothetical protein [Vibrio]|jgi:hypothetical protein|uniref:Uncharacterized protein n=1 Tax=Vibrio barjaei TaxID=1676683 RepID=A0ABW7IP11_9VIBR|nr:MULTISPECIES: hypothetical protein [Vibrio]EDL54694.1 hypothetical protein VSAK1_21094 [Vibrio mediterranei AK1]MCY9852143.1 hypothetical protein [Vibrio mediterranei]MCY9871727.1 hypothetical protein [Vibrio barjaei]
MNHALEKDIVDAMHHLNTEQLRDVKRFVERLSTRQQPSDLVTEEELAMIMELSASKRSYR